VLIASSFTSRHELSITRLHQVVPDLTTIMVPPTSRLVHVVREHQRKVRQPIVAAASSPSPLAASTLAQAKPPV